jgi:hypothetical protein
MSNPGPAEQLRAGSKNRMTIRELRPTLGFHKVAKPEAGKAPTGANAHKGTNANSDGLIKKLRKPMAPPTRIAEDERKYSRAREQERSRREAKDQEAGTGAKSTNGRNAG